MLNDMLALFPAYAADRWAQLTSYGAASYHPLWAPLLLFELAANLALLVAMLLLVVMFFRKRRGAPALFIGILAASVVVQALDLVGWQAVPALAARSAALEMKVLVRSIFALLIWGSYMYYADRVALTFVETWRAPRAPVPDRVASPSESPA